ncbi:MAG: ATP-binding protein [Rhodothermales bacterium]
MWRSALTTSRDLPAMPFYFDRRDERIVQSVRRLAMTVAHMFSAPGAYVALYEKDELLQLMACYGIDLAAYQESGFLSPALVTPGKALIVPDTDLDPAFGNDVWVTNAGIRFFAGAPMIDASGHPVGMLCVVDRVPRSFSSGHIKLLHDMASIGVSELSTHHRLRIQEEALRLSESRLVQSEALYERMTTGLPIPLFTVDADGMILSWNQACMDSFGFADEEVIGRQIGPLLVDEPEAGDFDTIISRVFNRRRISGLDLKLRTKRGSFRRLYCRLLPVYDPSGNIQACAFMAQDVTALRRLEQSNREQSACSRLVASLSSACSFSIAQEGDGTCWLQRVSDAFTATTGIPFDPGRPFRWTDVLHPEDSYATLSTYGALALNASATLMLRLRLPDGSLRTMQHAVQLVEHDPKTNLRRYLGVMRTAQDGPAEDWTQPAIDQIKSTILATMSHEIRTPLTSILGFAELLALQENDTHRRFARLIEESASRLLNTLGAVLDLAQLEDHLLPLNLETVDLGAHVKAIATPYRETAVAKGLHWHFHTPAAETYVRIDADASARALRHVLSNAIKFTRKGAIQITIAPREDAVELTIEDSGVGIGKEFLPYLFREFRQEVTGITRPYEGTGLGLAITKRLIESMGATIAIDSRKGSGTTVTMRFPFAAESDVAG